MARRIQIRSKVYRGKAGYVVGGTDGLDRPGISIFVRTRDGAERIATALRQTVDPYSRASADAYRAHVDDVMRQVFADEENPGRWIQKALRHHKKGALHRQLGIPAGEKIPADVLERASHAPGKLGRRARLAKTLRKMVLS